jgi:hypothetical protein
MAGDGQPATQSRHPRLQFGNRRLEEFKDSLIEAENGEDVPQRMSIGPRPKTATRTVVSGGSITAAGEVTRAMLHTALDSTSGIHFLRSAQIQPAAPTPT